MYLLNNKRSELYRIEETYGLHVLVDLRPELGPMDQELVRGESLNRRQVEEAEADETDFLDDVCNVMHF